MLSVLAGNSGPTEACRGRVLALSGTASSLSMSARMTLRGGLDAPWEELIEMSRGIRALAGEVQRLARAPGLERDLPRAPAARAAPRRA